MSAFVNRYVDVDGITYRVCRMKSGDGSPGRLMLIIKRGHDGHDIGPALNLNGRRARQVLAAVLDGLNDGQG